MRLFLRSAGILLLLMPMFFSGCIYVKTHPVGIMPSANNMKSAEYELLGEAEGVSSSFTLMWLLPVTPRVSQDAAFSEAIRSKGGDNLLGACIWSEKQIWILGTIDTIYVKGNVVRSLSTQAKKEK